MVNMDVKSVPPGAVIKVISSSTPTPTPVTPTPTPTPIQKGTFIVTTDPAYAQVSFNNGPYYPSPATYQNVISGYYDYSVGAKDFITYSSRIYIPPSTTIKKHVTLNSAFTPTPSPTPVPPRFEDFLDDCVNGNNLTCSWSKLETYLLDSTITYGWWDISEVIRRKIVDIAIQNTINERIYYHSTGKPYCRGQEGDWLVAKCVPNSIIRMLKMGNLPNVGQDEMICTPERGYYKYTNLSSVHCFYTSNCFNLPIHSVSCIKPDFTHALASILVNKDYSKIGSWVIFQYNDIDIKPGNWQLPYGSTVKFHELNKICRGCMYGIKKGEFKI